MKNLQKFTFLIVLLVVFSCKKDDDFSNRPELFSILDIEINIDNEDEIVNQIESITWEKADLPAAATVTYDLFLNNVVFASGIEEDESFNMVYTQDVDISSKYTAPIIVKIIATGDDGETQEVEETINFVYNQLNTLGDLNAGEFRTYFSTAESAVEQINFQFTVNSKYDYTIETVQGNYDTLIELYDENGDTINSDDNNGDGQLSKMEGTLTSGSYNLQVKGFSSSVGQGELVISLSVPL